LKLHCLIGFAINEKIAELYGAINHHS